MEEFYLLIMEHYLKTILQYNVVRLGQKTK